MRLTRLIGRILHLDKSTIVINPRPLASQIIHAEVQCSAVWCSVVQCGLVRCSAVQCFKTQRFLRFRHRFEDNGGDLISVQPGD